MYIPEAVLLITAGFQVPEIPLGEVELKVGTVLPVQIFKGVTSKFGVMLFPTVTFSETEVAHCPAFGVKVYVPEAVLLITAGLQVPEIPLGEVELKVGTVLPVQIFKGVTLKFGVIEFPTVTFNETEVAH